MLEYEPSYGGNILQDFYRSDSLYRNDSKQQSN